VHEELGRNSRLDALQAAVLLAKSSHLGAWQLARARLAAGYIERLASLPLTLPASPPAPAASAWHAFVVRCRSHGARDALAAWLRARGVETRVYYPVALHRQPCFASLREPTLPVAEEACRTALALPIHPTMTDAQHAYVVDQVQAFFAARAA
jgi:dTDP-4-amino-4,6-dideoxygalactose transaminase